MMRVNFLFLFSILTIFSITLSAQDAPSLSEPIAPEVEPPTPEVKPDATPEAPPSSPPATGTPAPPVTEPEEPIHQGPAATVTKAPVAPPVAAVVAAPVAAAAASEPEETAPEVTEPPPAEPQPAPVEVPAEEPKPEEEEHKFSKFTVSPQVGYAFFPKSEYDYDGLTLKVDQRNSFMAKLHLDLGGDGVSFEFAPLFCMEQVGGDLASIGADLGQGVNGKIFSVGGQTALVYRASWGKFYPHVGIGFHGTYLMGDNIQYGAEVYGRIPLGFTAYVAKRFALVFEAALMFGATGIRGPDPDESVITDIQQDYNVDINDIDWANTTPEEIQEQYNFTDAEMQEIVNDTIGDSIKFGKGFAFEVNVGFRFP